MPVAGGVSTHISTLVDCLTHAGYPVSVLTPLAIGREFGEARPLLRAVLTRLTQNAVCFMVLYRLARHLLQVRFGRFSKQMSNTVVNAHDVSAALAVTRYCKSRQVPLVLTVHGYLTYEAIADGKIRPGGFWARALLNDERRAYTVANAVICVDHRLADHVRTLCRAHPSITVLHNVVDTTMFRFDGIRRLEARRRLRVSHDDKVVLCPRRLVRKNGVDIAIKAMSLVLRNIPDALLLCAGEGQERQALERQIRLCGLNANVRLLGTVEHEVMNHLYCASDVVIIPSVEVDGVAEATSRSALEAMACGRAVIASAIGGLAELIQSGDNGLLVPPGDIVSLAQAIERLLSDSELAAKFGERARKTVMGSFRVRDYSRSIMAVYTESLVNSRVGRP